MVGGGYHHCLTSERWVASDTLNQRTEDRTDTDTSTSQANGSETSTLHLRGGNDGSSGRIGNDAARLHGASDHVGAKAGAELGASVVKNEAAADRLLRSEDGAWDGDWIRACLANSLR